MDKTPWLTAQGITSYDLNNMSKDAQKALAWAIQSLLGNTAAVVNGFAGSQTSSPSLSINLAQGWIYQLAAVDANPIGSLPADTTQIMQEGFAAAQSAVLNTSGISAGQSQWWLIEANFAQIDQVRVGDPTGGARGFYNSANPGSPLNGINGLGGTVPTVRLGAAIITAISGVAATTGTNVPPNPSAGCVPLFLINLAFGQTTITTAQILTAGPAAYAGYPAAPFLAGLLNSHHGGVPGQAPKINLATETTGSLTLAQLPVTDSVVIPAGGNVTLGTIIPVTVHTTVNPQGNFAGQHGDSIYNETNGTYWRCTVSGLTAGTTTWSQIISSTNPVDSVVTTFPYTPAARAMALLSVPGSGASIVMAAASTYGGVPCELTNTGTGLGTVTFNGAETCNGHTTLILYPGDSVKLYPVSATGFYTGPSKLDYVPPGGIILWYGTLASIPLGWALCDGGSYTSSALGTVSTPNLQGLFVVGAGQTAPAASGGMGLMNPGGPFGDASAGAGLGPSHTHTGATLNAGSGGGFAFQSITAATVTPKYYALCYIMRL